MRAKALTLPVVLVLLALVLMACGDNNPTRSSYIPPTPPPTPVAFDSVPPAATVAAGANKSQPAGIAQPEPDPTPASVYDDNDPGFINSDATALAQIYGTPGPGKGQPGSGGVASRAQPTPTLNFSPGQTNIASLRSSKVSFLFAYRQALARVQAVQRQAKIVFASASSLKPERTTWVYLFVWLEGRKMWRVSFDLKAGQDQPNLTIEESAPSMLDVVGQIDMNRVLDGDDLVSRAEAAGLRVTLPVDVFNFQLDGVSRQPSFVLTNSPQGKQVIINAYTGQILRNDFA